ncbi:MULTISPECIES: hypothetical protein [Sandaracinus]|uniref:hypothetical protein n=1 Tax=Sandaracinus TaxID=1055688 RepID=UPI0019D431B5|nr:MULTISPECIES: hypothetical protein [Sandaracinus]UJR87219.1 Hypothetical protein I5071_100 [Sandaracinus amylolyticus]
MTTKFDVRVDASRRVVFVRLTGLLNEQDLHAMARAGRAAHDSFAGRRHFAVADMRGMKTVQPALAEILGDAIRYGRQRGVVLCAHVSDDTVQRLQAARVARKYSVDDDVTVEVVSLEEANRVIASYSKHLDDPRYPSSIRAAIPAR